MSFVLTKEHVEQLLAGNPNIDFWYESMTKFFPEYEINTELRVAAFVAQCAHESSNFKVLKENLNYRAESLMKVWPSRFPTIEIAKEYAHNQERIANRAYASRMGNGPEESGDGWKFCGRGLIQLTGKNNYKAFADSVGMSLDELPEYLVTFDGALHSACWFWKTNNLNQLADSKDFVKLTQRINGGTIGLPDRQKHYDHALKVLLG